MSDKLKILEGAHLDSFPLVGLEWFSDILYLDGPLLSHYIAHGNVHYLYHWVDQDIELNRWMIYKVDINTLLSYLRGDDDLHDLFWKNLDDFVFIIDMKSNGEYNNIQYVNNINLPEDYIPAEQYFYEMEIPEEYNNFFNLSRNQSNDLEYNSLLKSEAIYINVKSTSRRHGNTVAVPEVLDFLKNFNSSYINFSEASFEVEFSNKYNDLSKFIQVMEQVKGSNVLRTADLGIGSFGIALVSDFVVNNMLGIDDAITKWVKELPSQFEHEVVDVDFDNPDQTKLLEEKYSPEQRTKFLNPYIRILENKNYKIAPADRNFAPIKRVRTISLLAKNRLISTDIKIDKKEEKSLEREVLTMVIETTKGEDLTRLSGRALASRMLSTKSITQFETEINSFDFKDRSYKLKSPIDLKTEFDGQFYLVTEPLTGINSQAKELDEAVKKIKEKLYRAYNRLDEMNNEFMTDLEMLELGKLRVLINGLN